MPGTKTRLLKALFLLALLAPSLAAQNVSGYGMMPDPFLFLLREPAVHSDLELSDSQKQSLIRLNESFDGILLKTRNTTPEEAKQQTLDVYEKTSSEVKKLFTQQQQERMRQIGYRIKGLPFVLGEDASRELGLSSQQKEDIKVIVSDTLESIKEAQTRTYQGAEAHQKSQETVNAARKREQNEILEALDDEQKRKLIALVGRSFDMRSLGRVSFKAPELSDGDHWLNSDALKLRDLRGKVVALHFWAFG